MPFISVKKSLIKDILVSVAALLTIVSTVTNAKAILDGGNINRGNLVLSIDRSVIKSIGAPKNQSLYIEHYFNKATSNSLDTPTLLTNYLDNIEIPGYPEDDFGGFFTITAPNDENPYQLGSYLNLAFGVQSFSLPAPLVGTQHQLQGTNFSLSTLQSDPIGQIGFGGGLRLNAYFPGTTTTNHELDAIIIGDFTLTKTDRSAGATGASGWVITTTTGLTAVNYIPIFDTKNVTVDLLDEETLQITGGLLWAPEALAFLNPNGFQLANAGSFVLTASSSIIPGDANGDGLVQITDVVSIINLVLNSGQSGTGADCNQDQEINILDVVCVINAILNQP